MTVQGLDETFALDWAQWRRRRDEALAAPHGFLAIRGLHWLSSEPQRWVNVPGEWWAADDGVRVALGPSEQLVVAGVVLRDQYSFGVIPERGGVNAVFGDLVLEVAKRAGHDIIRPRDPRNPLRVQYAGTPSYEPNPAWVVSGRYHAFDEPRPTTVGASVEGLLHVYDAPGRVDFDIAGTSLSLTAFNGARAGALSFLFTDLTSGVTTYAANRSLQTDAPDPNGFVTLDFNRSANLPCAYTDFATCPLPPAENRLPIAIEAGDKIPYERPGRNNAVG